MPHFCNTIDRFSPLPQPERGRNLRFACHRDRRLVSLIRGVSTAPRHFTQRLIRRRSGGRSYGRNAFDRLPKKGLSKVSPRAP